MYSEPAIVQNDKYEQKRNYPTLHFRQLVEAS
jgi:hypothetical protein